MPNAPRGSQHSYFSIGLKKKKHGALDDAMAKQDPAVIPISHTVEELWTSTPKSNFKWRGHKPRDGRIQGSYSKCLFDNIKRQLHPGSQLDPQQQQPYLWSVV